MHLRVGESTVLPCGVIEKLTSLEELQISVADETVGQFVKKLGKLHELRVLNVVLDVTEASMQSDLVDSLCNLSKIQMLELNGIIRDR